MLEMKVRGLTLDPLSNMALVILRDLEGNRALPIWVGIPEANAIAVALRVKAPIYVTLDVIERAGSIEAGMQNVAEEPDRLKEWLDNIKPEDFGKL